MVKTVTTPLGLEIPSKGSVPPEGADDHVLVPCLGSSPAFDRGYGPLAALRPLPMATAMARSRALRAARSRDLGAHPAARDGRDPAHRRDLRGRGRDRLDQRAGASVAGARRRRDARGDCAAAAPRVPTRHRVARRRTAAVETIERIRGNPLLATDRAVRLDPPRRGDFLERHPVSRQGVGGLFEVVRLVTSLAPCFRSDPTVGFARPRVPCAAAGRPTG